jgi:hypothetical protein
MGSLNYPNKVKDVYKKLVFTNDGTNLLRDGSSDTAITNITANITGTASDITNHFTGLSLTSLSTNDFLKWDGSKWINSQLGTVVSLEALTDTDVSGAPDGSLIKYDYSSSKWIDASLSDCGIQSTLSFGIANTNAVKVDHASVAENDYAQFTTSGIQGRSYAEVRSDLGISDNEILDWSADQGDTNIHAGNYTNTNQLTEFTLTGDSGSNQTIAHGNTLDIAGGTGIDTVVSATDTVTVSLATGSALSNLGGGSGSEFLKKDGTWATPTDTNTQNTTTLSFVDSSNDIILRNTTGGAGSGTDDIKFVAGSNITLTHTDADNITIASADTNTNELTTFTLRDDDDDAFTIAHGKFLKVVAATGALGTNITGSGTTGDPWVLTITSPDTDTAYTKASFDLDHLFTLVGASADTSENLGTFTGSTIADNQTVKASIQALETALELKAPIASPDFTGDLTTVGDVTVGDDLIIADAAYFKALTVISSSSSTAIDWTSGNKQIYDFDANHNKTVTFTDPAAGNGTSCSLTLIIKQYEDTNSQEITWPTEVKWPGGSAPTLSSGSGDYDIVSFLFTKDGSGNVKYYGSAALDFS